jgi:hypothetical protein
MEAQVAANLTPQERREWIDKLCRSQSLDHFSTLVDELWHERGDFLLTDQRAAFFREAHAALTFASLRAATKVRLIEADRPDFEVELGLHIHAYEFTEADTPGRRRGQEIAADRTIGANIPVSRPFPSDEWLTPHLAEQILRSAAAKKANGGYEPHCGLLILLNPIEFDAYRTEIEALMQDATYVACRCFSEVWVLWKGRAYNPWKEGGRQDQGPLSPA